MIQNGCNHQSDGDPGTGLFLLSARCMWSCRLQSITGSRSSRKTAGGRDVSAGKFVLPEMLRQMFDEVAFDLRAECLGAESPGVRAALGGIE